VASPPGGRSRFHAPDRTFLLDLPAEAGLARLRGRGRSVDRLESEDVAFHRAVIGAYRELAAAEPGRWVTIDATLPPGQIHAAVMASLAGLLVRVP